MASAAGKAFMLLSIVEVFMMASSVPACLLLLLLEDSFAFIADNFYPKDGTMLEVRGVGGGKEHCLVQPGGPHGPSFSRTTFKGTAP